MPADDEGLMGPDQLTILGGRTTADVVQQLFEGTKWPDDGSARYGIWEYMHRMEFNDGTAPSESDWEFLERAEVFGNDGHLSIRRDGDIVRWSLITGSGSTGAVAIHEDFDREPYWTGEDDQPFNESEGRMMLWGRWDEGTRRWEEARVARAPLDYPCNDELRDRIVVTYRKFTSGGQVHFIWLTGLHGEAAHEGDDHGR